MTPWPTPMPTHLAPVVPSCGAKLDLIVVLDGSTSVGADAFTDLKLFLKQFVRSFDLSGQAVEVGITHFSSADVFVNSQDGGVSEVVSPLTADKSTLIGAIDNMMYGGGRRYTAQALREAAETMRPQRRPGVPAVYLVITDGFPSDMDDILDAASGVRGDGRLVFSVVGVAGLAQQLSFVVSAPYESTFSSRSTTTLCWRRSRRMLARSALSNAASKERCPRSTEALSPTGPFRFSRRQRPHRDYFAQVFHE